ncbi:unnamed protein product [Caenorhabditis auriculariae]|uniref:G-protein coupled receptors family 1 profile domain-containing protein n=1 Tax=Caenorhabditis auriculariae TaxID=2777116 RepID=A0A8S1HMK6_9PELO|nr:unnamed protein product [Caenorhabditis auriculariae]
MSSSWPVYVWDVQTVLAVPLYVAVLVAIRQLRCSSKSYRSSFYTFLFQHGIADLLCMTIYFLLIHSRSTEPWKTFLYKYQEYYLAAASYNSIYFTLYLRCNGIILLTLHRFFSVCLYSTKWNSIIQKASPRTVIMVYWIIPLAVSFVALRDTNSSFSPAMDHVVEISIVTRNTVMATIVVSVTCAVCIIIYVALFFFVRNKMLST